MRYGGREVPGFGLSDFAQAQADLVNQVVLPVTEAGDVYYGESVKNYVIDFTDAVLAYQAAGQAGASNVGPEIDASGAPNVTQPLTHAAWILNAQLATLSRSGPPDPKNKLGAYYNQSDADAAKSLVSQMIGHYQTAIASGAAAKGEVLPSPSAPPTQPSSSSAPYWIAAAAAVIAIGIGVAVVRS